MEFDGRGKLEGSPLVRGTLAETHASPTHERARRYNRTRTTHTRNEKFAPDYFRVDRASARFFANEISSSSSAAAVCVYNRKTVIVGRGIGIDTRASRSRSGDVGGLKLSTLNGPREYYYSGRTRDRKRERASE